MDESIFNARAFARLVAQEIALILERSLADEVLTTQEAAALLKIHPNTLTQLTSKDDIPGRRVGREWRFTRSSLLEYVRNQGPTPEPQTPY